MEQRIDVSYDSWLEKNRESERLFANSVILFVLAVISTMLAGISIGHSAALQAEIDQLKQKKYEEKIVYRDRRVIVPEIKYLPAPPA